MALARLHGRLPERARDRRAAGRRAGPALDRADRDRAWRRGAGRGGPGGGRGGRGRRPLPGRAGRVAPGSAAGTGGSAGRGRRGRVAGPGALPRVGARRAVRGRVHGVRELAARPGAGRRGVRRGGRDRHRRPRASRPDRPGPRRCSPPADRARRSTTWWRRSRSASNGTSWTGAAFLRWELAEAYRRAGRTAEAAEAAEEALGALDRLGHQAEADRCRHLLASIYLALGEQGPALDLLDELAENLDGPDNLPHRAQVLEEAGGTCYDQDRDNLAAQRFAAAASAYQAAGLRLDELRARRREVMALCWAGRPGGGARRAGAGGHPRGHPARRPRPPEPAPGPAVNPEYGPALRWSGPCWPTPGPVRCSPPAGGRGPGPVSGVADRLRSIEAFGEALHVDLLTGELLVRVGRPAEAEPAAPRYPRRPACTVRPGPAAAWLLAEALSALGRSTRPRRCAPRTASTRTSS